MGAKEIGERVQDDIDDVHHGHRPIPKGLSKTCQCPLLGLLFLWKWSAVTFLQPFNNLFAYSFSS